MREIKYIVLHCTATPQNTTVKSILNYWKAHLGWRDPGYHFIIKKDGEVVNLHPIEKPSNGVAGYNQNSIHISYIGGIDEHGKPLDNRTIEQQCAILNLISKYKKMFPAAKILGHRDFPGVTKSCPSFSVSEWLKTVII